METVINLPSPNKETYEFYLSFLELLSLSVKSNKIGVLIISNNSKGVSNLTKHFGSPKLPFLLRALFLELFYELFLAYTDLPQSGPKID